VAEIDIVLSVLGSASALYGFTVAYYVFARGIQDQERARIWQSHREWHLPPHLKQVYGDLLRIEVRRALMDGFLILSTSLFAALVGEDFLYLAASPQPLGVGLFFWLALLVVLTFGAIGVVNLKEALCELCKVRLALGDEN
jgi:hypothetical protein